MESGGKEKVAPLSGSGLSLKAAQLDGGQSLQSDRAHHTTASGSTVELSLEIVRKLTCVHKTIT